MSDRSLLLQLDAMPAGPVTLRAGRCAYSDADHLVILDADGILRLKANWIVEDCQLSADGRYVSALGDEGRYASVWDATSGRLLLDLAGVTGRRQSLRIGLASVDGEPAVLAARFNEPLSVVSLRDRREIARLTTAGVVWFHALAFAELDPRRFAVRGHLDGEQYDSIVVLPWEQALRDHDVLQSALTQPAGFKAWGYQIGVGPGTDGEAVLFRDPEWGDEEPPDDEVESFCGIAIWNLAAAITVQRIPLPPGSMPTPVALGADATRVAMMIGSEELAIVNRLTGAVIRRAALALDPFRLQFATREPGGIIVTPL